MASRAALAVGGEAPPTRLRAIEAGRGLAAVLVVATHARDSLITYRGDGSFLGDFFQFGHAGVDFFFVLSGFIILHVHAGDIGRPIRLMRYVRRRAGRIYPLYWAVLLATIAVLLLAHQGMGLSMAALIRSALLWPGGGAPLVGVAWTLQHELVFYGAFACLIVERRFGAAVLGFWFVAITAALLAHNSAPYLSVFDIEFFLGMGACWLLRHCKVRLPWLVGWGAACGFLAVGLAEDAAWLSFREPGTHLLYAVASTGLVLGLVELERGGRLRVPAIWVRLGSASYAIYLTHILVNGAVWRALSGMHFAGYTPVWVAFVLLVATGTLGGILVSEVAMPAPRPGPTHKGTAEESKPR